MATTEALDPSRDTVHNGILRHSHRAIEAPRLLPLLLTANVMFVDVSATGANAESS